MGAIFCTPLNLFFVGFLSAFSDDLVSDLFCCFEAFSAADQLVDYVMPGLFDERFIVPFLDSPWGASTSSTWALEFAEMFAECQGTDQLDPMLRGGD